MAQKVIIETGLYMESESRRKPIYTTENKNNHFGGIHYTLENLIKERVFLTEIVTCRDTNATERLAVAKKFKITIEEIK